MIPINVEDINSKYQYEGFVEADQLNDEQLQWFEEVSGNLPAMAEQITVEGDYEVVWDVDIPVPKAESVRLRYGDKTFDIPLELVDQEYLSDELMNMSEFLMSTWWEDYLADISGKTLIR